MGLLTHLYLSGTQRVFPERTAGPVPLGPLTGSPPPSPWPCPLWSSEGLALHTDGRESPGACEVYDERVVSKGRPGSRQCGWV